MTDKEVIAALRRMKVETGSLVCWGCGHEHNCGIRGCAVMRAAAERLEWLTGPEGLAAVPATKGDVIRRMPDRELAEELFNFRFDGYAKAQGAETVLPDTVQTIEKWLKEEMCE